MTMTRIKSEKTSEKTIAEDWYYWGRWNQVMLFTAPWVEFSKTRVFKKLDLNDLKGDLKVLHGNYYFPKSDLEKICKKVNKNLGENSLWFKKFFKICDENTKTLLLYEGQQNILAFIAAMIQTMGCSALVEMIDMCIERYLKKFCKKEKIEFTKVAAHVRPPRPTLLIQYQKNLVNINESKVDSFVRRNKWVGTHALEGRALKKKDVLKNLKEKRRLIKAPVKLEPLPKKLSSIVQIASELSFYRSNLMETVDKVAFSYRRIFKTIGKKHGLGYQDVISLTQDELKLLLEKNQIPSYLKARGKHFGMRFIDGSLSVLLGQALKKELIKHEMRVSEDINEIAGTPACKGIVRGVAKILTEVEHADKIKNGDVLVAHETTPDYILAMRKAAAFVTDIGGLTCHAAITAREMNKPCIIGTKNATKILKDGDFVEVNADNGIIKIFK